ncbi:hypothetical protein BYT27DRAFT_6775941 [Phlegmacium glaucopus]|nr:hypothetical protein BYT27DRAFT_6775941 [Phlegmacium glaucopus]
MLIRIYIIFVDQLRQKIGNDFIINTRSVSKFILRDVPNKDSQAQTSPAAFLRLAGLQQPDMPLIPSLTDIVVVGRVSLLHSRCPAADSIFFLDHPRTSCPSPSNSNFWSRTVSNTVLLYQMRKAATKTVTCLWTSTSTSTRMVYLMTRTMASDTEILPMPVSGGIDSLREKLHARIAQLRRGGGKTLATKMIYWRKHGCGGEPRCVKEEAKRKEKRFEERNR